MSGLTRSTMVARLASLVMLFHRRHSSLTRPNRPPWSESLLVTSRLAGWMRPARGAQLRAFLSERAAVDDANQTRSRFCSTPCSLRHVDSFRDIRLGFRSDD